MHGRVSGRSRGGSQVGDLSVPAPDLRALAPGADAGLAAVLGRALRKRPAERFRTASDMAAALRGVLAGLG